MENVTRPEAKNLLQATRQFFEIQMLPFALLTLLVWKMFHVRNENGTSLLAALFILALVLFISPLLIITLLVCRLYRFICHLYLQWTVPNYLHILDGPDAFWTLDETVSKNVINILAFVDFGQKDKNQCMALIKSTIERQLLPNNLEEKYKKIVFRRKSQSFGFTYWKAAHNFNINDHVKLIKTDTSFEYIHEPDLKSILSKLCNLDLPREHTTNWDVSLIDKRVMTKGKTLVNGILIRIHHSVGDGYALVDFFLNVLTKTKNKTDEYFNNFKPDDGQFKESEASLADETQETHNNDPPSAVEKSSETKREINVITSPSLKTSMAKLNWNFLKIKTRDFLSKKQKRGETFAKVEHSEVVGEDFEGKLNSDEICPQEKAVHRKLLRNTRALSTEDKPLIIKPSTGDEVLTDLVHNIKSSKAALKLGLQNSSQRIGTVYLNDVYYTPISPIDSSRLFEHHISCSTRLDLISMYKLACRSFIWTKEAITQTLSMVRQKLSSKLFPWLFLTSNLILKRIDKNNLHHISNPLTKHKVISYTFDDELFEMIKHIKKKQNKSFNEVIFKSISDSLELYFEENVESIHAIIPVPLSTKRDSMMNDFTVCMMDLPISHRNKSNIISEKYKNLFQNREHTFSYIFLKYILHCLPNFISKLVAKSLHSTLVVSNMIGPRQELTFAGYDITRLLFFVPTKDTTGVGITLLSYKDQLGVGIIMDESLNKNSEAVQRILDNMTSSIHRMYEDCVLTQ